MGSVAERLGRVNWRRHGVLYAVLFGSALHSRSFHDVDIAVRFHAKPSLDKLLELVREVADAVGVPDDKVDIVVLNDDTPCVLVEEALGKGRLVYCRDREECISDILRRLKLCWDFEISYRKLNLLKTALEAVKRRWRC